MNLGDFEERLADPRYAEFRKYLDEQGLMAELVKILVQLYETNERPSDSVGFCRDHFSKVGGIDINVVQAESAKITERIAELNEKIADLEKELSEEPPPPETK
jgi:hypothetical protein